MIGDISPALKNLLAQANTWRQSQNFLGATNTFTQENLGTTPTSVTRLENLTAATSGNQQASPATEWHGHGWKTNSVAASQNVSYRAYMLPVQGTAAPSAIWKLQSSINDASYVDRLEMLSTAVDGVDFPQLRVTGAIKSTVANSATIDTLQNLDIVTTGSRVNVTHSFGSTIRSGIQTTDQGSVSYYSADSSANHMFYIGSTIGVQQYVIQIYGGGIYNSGGSYNQSKVTAGGADTTPPAFLSNNGSTAFRGNYITTNTTLGENDHFNYVDASSNNICTGTPSALCSSYLTQGNCEAHNPAGCTWQAAVTESCSGYGGIDIATCEGVSGCAFDQASCSGANNAGSTVCTDQNTAYTGSCSYDESTCPSQSTSAACNSIAGCSADVSADCSAFSDGGGDGAACVAAGGGGECSYDSGSGVCSGTYFAACNGAICQGNYYTGGCSGTHTITPAQCSGTALCSNITSGSVACAFENGCSWTSGVTITLPPSSQAAKGNVSREYYVVNVGSSGTVTIVPTSGGTLPDTILGYGSGVALTAQNHHAAMKFHAITSPCSIYNSNQSSCESTAGCSFQAAVVCSSYNGDESACLSNGCAYSEGVCSGAGSSSSCSGTFTSVKPWIVHSLRN